MFYKLWGICAERHVIIFFYLLFVTIVSGIASGPLLTYFHRLLLVAFPHVCNNQTGLYCWSSQHSNDCGLPGTPTQDFQIWSQFLYSLSNPRVGVHRRSTICKVIFEVLTRFLLHWVKSTRNAVSV